MDSEPANVDALFARFCRTGDPRALGEAYDRVAPELFRIALHTMHDAAQAEDVLQATFVAAIERRASFDARQRAMPWLVGILANEAKRARERARREVDPARIESRGVPRPESDAERAELDERLDQALAKLPEAFRPVLVLRLKHGLSASEIAEALGISPGTVRSRLARGTEQLRRSLPAGLAGAWLASWSPPARGLELVREAVVAHAVALQPLAAASAALSGVLAMKKVLLASAAAAVIATTWLAWPAAQPVQPRELEVAAEPALAERDVPRAAREVADDGRELASSRVAVRAPEATSTEAAAPASELATLVVRALGSSGEAAAGEIVLVLPSGASVDDTLLRRADDAGVARFEGLPPAGALVRLLRGGERNVELARGRTTEVELRVAAGVTVEGAVSDAAGRGLADAEIWLSERYRTNLGYVVARSDADGRFTLRDVGPDYFLAARARGFATSGLRTVRGAPGESLRVAFVLERAGVSVRGRVRGPRGELLGGARVLLGVEQPLPTERLDNGSSGFGPPPLRATTDERGEFELAHAPLGAASLQVRARGFAPFAETVEIREPLAPLEIELAGEARVEGQVLDERGRPVGQAFVRAGDPDLFGSSYVYSRADGRFALAGLAAGAVHVVAEHRDRGRAEVELAVAPGAAVEWNPRLVRELAIAGRVLDPQRRPLAGWVVLALPGGDSSRRVQPHTTAADGAFAIAGIGDESHTLWIQRADGWRDFPLSIVEDVRPGGAPLELIVDDREARAARIAVRVLSPDRQPVAGAELQVWHEDLQLWRSFVAHGSDGRIEVEDAPPGTSELELRHAEFPWLSLGRRELLAGETLDLGDVVLDQPGRLRARLRGVDAGTLRNVRALLTNASNRESGVARVEEGGELRSGPLAAGRHTLVLRGDFVRMVKLDVEVHAGVETELDLALERCEMRRVVFELPPGAVRPRWLACGARDGGPTEPWFDSVGANGPLEARVSLPRGVYRLVAVGEGGWGGEWELAIDGSSEALVVGLTKR